MTEQPPLLEVRGLSTSFVTPRGLLQAVDSLSFNLRAGEALGIVGESGSGKSVTALTMLRLFGPLTTARVSGEVIFEGRDLLRLSEKELRGVRGAQIGMVFQDPLTSLNPTLPIGDQVAEAARHHLGLSREQGRQLAGKLLERVGIPDAWQRLDDLPHRFSGGMRQRIVIALAIACQPKMLIADEPTAALDVTVQAQVLVQLDELRRELGMALIIISHDFGVVAGTCDRVLVMYGGQLVEQGTVQHILESARHPYTRALLKSVPRLDGVDLDRLETIPGQPITISASFQGCRFAPRCELVLDTCREESPPLISFGPDHVSACWRARELSEPVVIASALTSDPADALAAEVPVARRGEGDQTGVVLIPCHPERSEGDQTSVNQSVCHPERSEGSSAGTGPTRRSFASLRMTRDQDDTGSG